MNTSNRSHTNHDRYLPNQQRFFITLTAMALFAAVYMFKLHLDTSLEDTQSIRCERSPNHNNNSSSSSAIVVPSKNYVVQSDNQSSIAAAETKSEETTTSPLPNNNNNNNRGVLNYNLHPTQFINAITSCTIDPNCHIYYHHVSKSGGKTIETLFSHIFQSIESRNQACCYKDMEAKFHKNPWSYCRRQFTSFEVLGQGFESIVRACVELHSKNAKRKKDPLPVKRVLTLSSFREPYGQMLSNIHQNCNKNLDRRSKELREACKQCQYEGYEDQWSRFTKESIRIFTGLNDYILKSDYFQSQRNLDDDDNNNNNLMENLMIDVQDLSSFLQGFEAALPSEFSKSFQQSDLIQNQEKLSLCSFGLKSPMMKEISLCRDIYRNLTLQV